MKSLLIRLFDHQALSEEEAYTALREIATDADLPAVQVAAFLTVFQMRSITVEELAGFRRAMLDLCLSLDLGGIEAIDLCGTGGDGKDTFNISTLASFVVAAAGVPVVKHGNYGVSSVSGSSNVIEHLGGEFTNDPDRLRRQLDSCNICFLHAPLFHPAMKNVAPIRRELGVKTFFNMLGPMVNPARPKYQLVGVFSLELARLYGYLYQDSGQNFSIIHSLDGYDEVSLTGPAKRINARGEAILHPSDFGMERIEVADLAGGKTVAASAAIFKSILEGEGTAPQRQVVLANAALAIQTSHPGLGLAEGMALATEALDSGRAAQTFKKFIES